ncbi:glycoside hydrolase family 17 protein [Thermothelomyces heterothallicus CBS 202.75]|uniref:glycoside hydrolase family 17 protein n=1 Tax=Thermothelomyces heterothallicus CBS 202.75 TaxID=1149848 RepID=UPI0037432388
MAQPRYYSDDEMAASQPLGGPGPTPPRHRQFQQSYYYYQDAHDRPPSQDQPRPQADPSFDRLRSQRRYNQEAANGGRGGTGQYAPAGTTLPSEYSGHGHPASPPRASPQRGTERRSWGQATSYPPQAQRPSPQTTIAPGADNFSNAAAGCMAGIALTAAEQNARESGLDAIHGQQQQQQPSPPQQQPYHQHGNGREDGYGERGMLSPGSYHPGDRNSHASLQGLASAPLGSGYSTPGSRTSSRIGVDIYTDDPYQNYSRHQDSDLGVVNPHDIIDDGDDGLEYGRSAVRTSMLSIGSKRDSHGAAAAGGAGTGGVLGGLVGRNGSGSVSNQYAPVSTAAPGDAASGGSGGGGGIYTAAAVGAGAGGEKAALHSAVSKGSGRGRKWKFAILIALAVAIVAGVVLGILFGVVLKDDHKGGSKSGAGSDDSTSTADGDTKANGDLDADSSEIQVLMNNPDLRKVFPGMDYTPLNTQYPDCLTNPPSQNNVTRDMAVLSRLTNVVRLYGTDCNQTEMVIHAVNQLKLQDEVKIWLGVWQDKNETTNARQLRQMWNILDKYGTSYFKGIIVANEILFRQEMTITQLGSLLEEVRHNLTERKMSLPVATSDLGDNWTAGLAAQSDAIMANIHPFFSGTKVSEAADWTMYFWGNKTSGFLKKDKSMNIIAETGWPSSGGTNCGSDYVTECPDGAVAGIDEMNRFLEDWVCRALEDGTEYFWFEAFDEPWKIRFNEPGKEWEDKWGLLTVDRKLKDGLKIPDCGGKRVSSS